MLSNRVPWSEIESPQLGMLIDRREKYGARRDALILQMSPTWRGPDLESPEVTSGGHEQVDCAIRIDGKRVL